MNFIVNVFRRDVPAYCVVEKNTAGIFPWVSLRDWAHAAGSVSAAVEIDCLHSLTRRELNAGCLSWTCESYCIGNHTRNSVWAPRQHQGQVAVGPANDPGDQKKRRESVWAVTSSNAASPPICFHTELVFAGVTPLHADIKYFLSSSALRPRLSVPDFSSHVSGLFGQG